MIARPYYSPCGSFEIFCEPKFKPALWLEADTSEEPMNTLITPNQLIVESEKMRVVCDAEVVAALNEMLKSCIEDIMVGNKTFTKCVNLKGKKIELIKPIMEGAGYTNIKVLTYPREGTSVEFTVPSKADSSKAESLIR